jgi:hypothetical protein
VPKAPLGEGSAHGAAPPALAEPAGDLCALERELLRLMGDHDAVGKVAEGTPADGAQYARICAPETAIAKTPARPLADVGAKLRHLIGNEMGEGSGECGSAADWSGANARSALAAVERISPGAT